MVLGLTAAGWVACAGAEPPTPTALTPEAVADFQWFSTLGFPDVRDCPTVRVSEGGQSHQEDQSYPARFLDGFLLHRGDGGRFTVLGPALFVHDYTAAPATADRYAVGYAPEALPAVAAAFLAKTEQTPIAQQSSFEFGPATLLDPGQPFVWAWACWRKGLDAEAARLYALAAALPNPNVEGEQAATLRGRLAHELAYAGIWRATLDFENPAISRTQLAETFERVARCYPGSVYAGGARQTADALRTMAAEDQAHAARAAGALVDLPTGQRVAELIFQLRDQTGEQMSDPGYCEVLPWQFPGGADQPDLSPAGELAALGTAAVPQLIGALDDPDFSRAVGHQRRFYFSHHVLTVGDCAEQILERIAGRRFYTPRTSSSYLSKDGDIPAVRAAALSWWQSVQGKGEQEILIEAVRRGKDPDAYQAARTLLARFPAAALPPLIEAVNRGNMDRGQTVRLIAEVPGAEATAFLEKELHDDPDPAGRMPAAESLYRRGHRDEAVDATIKEWERWRTWRAQPRTDEYVVEQNPFGELITFLANCGRADAITALGQDLRQRPVAVRLGVVWALNPDPDQRGTWEVKPEENRQSAGTEARGADETARIRAARVALLGGELDDEEPCPGTNGQVRGKMYPDRCPGDYAAAFLAALEGGKYRYDLGAPPGERERERTECLHAWRAEHGKGPVALPP